VHISPSDPVQGVSFGLHTSDKEPDLYLTAWEIHDQAFQLGRFDLLACIFLCREITYPHEESVCRDDHDLSMTIEAVHIPQAHPYLPITSVSWQGL
jgi:hypothetical protein